MKVRDLQLYLRYSLSKDILLGFLRKNFIGLLLILIIAFAIDYADYFKGENEFWYIIFSGFCLLFLLIIFVKYKNPLAYYPRYALFVKDRNDSLVKMEPRIDPLIVALGLIKPKDFVNVRYVVYPELDLGLDFDPNTGVISGFPLELGNYTSEIKMKFLGGEFSTTIRVEVIETAVLRERVEGSPLAAPRTIAQLLLREEDLKKREQEIDFRLENKKMDMEDEYVSKQISLEEQFDLEKSNFSVVLEKNKKKYEKLLEDKEKILEKKQKDFERRLKKYKDAYEKELAEFEGTISTNQEKIDELETLAMETGSAAANIEEEYVDLMDALATDTSDKDNEKGEISSQEKVVKSNLDSDREDEDLYEQLSADTEPEDNSLDDEEEVVEEEPEEETEEEYDYVSMTKAELVELAEKRNLSTSGNKKKIISRLEKD